MDIQAALDYKFAAEKKNKPETSDSRELQVRSARPVAFNNETPTPPGGISKAAYNKTIGPLSVSNVGIQFKSGKLFVILDATVALGPIALSLLGFGLGFTPTAEAFEHFDPSAFAVEFRGLAAALDKPPVLLAGMFENLSTEDQELFAGGIAVGFKLHSFLAFGSYGVIHNPSQEKFKTFFLFAQLDGPLVELEFATLNGVKLGFG